LAQQHALVLSAAALLQQNCYSANNIPQHGSNGRTLQHRDLHGKLHQLLQLMAGCNVGQEWRCSVQRTAMLALQQQQQLALGSCSGYVSSRMLLSLFQNRSAYCKLMLVLQVVVRGSAHTSAHLPADHACPARCWSLHVRKNCQQLLRTRILCLLHQLCSLAYISNAAMLPLSLLAVVARCSTGSCSCSCSMQLPYLAGSAAAVATTGSSTASAGLQEAEATMLSQLRQQHQKQ
jgi:hypothetical protein